jgi:hypothetical protein
VKKVMTRLAIIGSSVAALVLAGGASRIWR